MLALGLIALGCLMLEGAMTDWSAVYLGQVGGASPVVATLGYAAFSLTMLVGRLFGDGIRGRFGGPRVIVGGALLATLGLALAVLLPAPGTAILGFALVGLGLSNVVPAAFSAAGSRPTSTCCRTGGTSGKNAETLRQALECALPMYA